ncbi:hypothetical protein PMAN_a0531 [Pseudoalteromonas marina]|nr:hypothetical protein PMAN_a0531 [Pseudoalteromonas marina]
MEQLPFSFCYYVLCAILLASYFYSILKQKLCPKIYKGKTVN